MAIEIGSTVEGTVVRVADYGAIVRLAGGKMGLVHISEVADTFVRDVREYFRENDRIVVKVLRLNNKGRYELSAKQADPSAVQREEQPRADSESYGRSRGRRTAGSFEERLSQFLKDSEERLLDLRRNIDGKRGGGGRR
jgi:S1 RNA binding domain protein